MPTPLYFSRSLWMLILFAVGFFPALALSRSWPLPPPESRLVGESGTQRLLIPRILHAVSEVTMPVVSVLMGA